MERVKNWVVWLKAQRALLKRAFPALATILVVAALAGTFYGIALARSHARSLASADDTTPTATTSLGVPTPTLPPLSGPTPTPPTGGQPAVPSNGTAAFIAQAVSAYTGCGNSPVNNPCAQTLTCPTTFDIDGYPWFPKNAPDGYFTYRFRGSDGTITAPQTGHYSWDDKYGQNMPIYKYQPNPATSDGRNVTFQFELLTPNAMISKPSDPIHIVCATWIKGMNILPDNGNYAGQYDCATGGSQSFLYTATVNMAPSPSFTFTYYWKRPDGTVSATQTATTVGGATSVTLNGDALIITPSDVPPAPPPGGAVAPSFLHDTLVINTPPDDVNFAYDPQYVGAGLPVLIPNCNVITPTPPTPPTPTAPPPPTPTPTPTIAPSPTATP